MKKTNRNGVSLAELLAVVVVMGIIAAIAIPLVGNVVKESKRKALFADLGSIAEAARIYCMVENVTDGICTEYEGATLFEAASKADQANTLIFYSKEIDLVENQNQTIKPVSKDIKLQNYYSKSFKDTYSSGIVHILNYNGVFYIGVTDANFTVVQNGEDNSLEPDYTRNAVQLVNPQDQNELKFVIDKNI